MPTYRRPNREKGFRSALHIVDFLQHRGGSPLYNEHFRNRAGDWLQKSPYKLQKKSLRLVRDKGPRHLADIVMSEMRHASKGKLVGGGVAETIQSLGRMAWNLVGGPKLTEWMGHKKYPRRKIPREAQIFAAAVGETYTKKGERKASMYGMKRLPRYDTDRCSVWLQQNGDYFVSVHGTKGMDDILTDVGVLAGSTVKSDEVERLVRGLLDEGHRVDIGGHSLATQYITNLPASIIGQLDEIYLFNPASSPEQSPDYLNKVLQQHPNTYWYINPSDVVSSGVYNQMSGDFVKKHVYLGNYRWSLLGAHTIDQWSTDIDSKDPEEVAENYEVTSRERQKNPDESYRAHLKGIIAQQELAKNEKKSEEETE